MSPGGECDIVADDVASEEANHSTNVNACLGKPVDTSNLNTTVNGNENHGTGSQSHS